MNKSLQHISTDRLETARKDAVELNDIVAGIYAEYGGWNIRSIERLINVFGEQIEINGDTYFEGHSRYADSKCFSWNGDPAKLEMLRMGAYKSLAYIYFKMKPGLGGLLIDRFDIGYEDMPEWGDSVGFAAIAEEIKERKPLIPKAVMQEAVKLFTDLQQLLSINELSLCYDEDNAAVFIGPKDMAWNVSQKPGEPGSLRDPKLRKFVTNEMINEYAEEGHIASEAICHLHISDPDDTFRDCDLTYAV